MSDLIDKYRTFVGGETAAPGTLEGFLYELKVTTNYSRVEGNTENITKVRAIKGFATGQHNSQELTFIGSKGTISVAEYFKTCKFNSCISSMSKLIEYSDLNQRINRPELPVVNIGSRTTPVYVPPEMCNVNPGQMYYKKLSALQTSKIRSVAVQKPEQNAEEVINRGLPVMGLLPSDPRLVSVLQSMDIHRS